MDVALATLLGVAVSGIMQLVILLITNRHERRRLADQRHDERARIVEQRRHEIDVAQHERTVTTDERRRAEAQTFFMTIIQLAEQLRVLLLEGAIRAEGADDAMKNLIQDKFLELWDTYMEGEVLHVQERDTMVALHALAVELGTAVDIIAERHEMERAVRINLFAESIKKIGQSQRTLRVAARHEIGLPPISADLDDNAYWSGPGL